MPTPATSVPATPDLDTGATDHTTTITAAGNDITITFHPDSGDDITVRIDEATILENTDLVDVELIDPDDSYNEGYAAAAKAYDTAAAEVMRRWHNDHHAGVVQFCYEQPCADLRTAVGA